MDCNREEAVRAKVIAEKKMQQMDFFGARKIALKAQQLFPDIENIAQMLTVCEVHCAEAIKVNAQEDWYGILQVEPTADENSIKKQYRKLAFLLHPDKNKFVGAESAFKLIGEAQRMLLDKANRSLYDSRRRTNIRNAPSMTTAQRTGQTSYSTAHSNVLNRQQQSQNSASQTFWTFCPFCTVRYQYYQATMSRAVHCQNCLKTFIAYDMNSRDMPPYVYSNFPTKQSGIPQRNDSTASTTFRTTHAFSSTGFQGTTAPGPWSRSRVNTEFRATGNATNPQKQCHDDSKNENEKVGKVNLEKVNLEKVNLDKSNLEKVNLKKVNSNAQAAKSSGKSKRKRTKQLSRDVSDDECSSFTDSSYSDDEIGVENDGYCNVDTTDSKNPRRSTRQKQNVTYTEHHSDDDDDFVIPRRKRGNIKSSNYLVLSDEDVDEVNISSNKSNNTTDEGEEDIPEGSSDATQVSESFSYPDSEFHDFSMERRACDFAVGQIWALYDEVDSMPRYYVKITKILLRDFRVRFSWLEHIPADQNEKEWGDAGLPVACGMFKVGEPHTTENIDMFSHVMYPKNSKTSKKLSLTPQLGEIWAMYKRWDTNWSSTHKKCKSFDYEVVKILSVGPDGFGVTHLIKVKGFVSLFAPGSHYGSVHIPHSEILRFSHMIPSYRVPGNDKKDIPEGSCELDPAALPLNFEDKFPSASFEDINGKSEKSEVGIGDEAKSRIPSKPGTCRVDASVNDDSRNRSVHLEGKDRCMERQFPDLNVSSSSTGSDKPLENDKESHPMFFGPSSKTQFHTFESDKSFDDLAEGEVWALYSQVDGFPRDYAYVEDVQGKVSKVLIVYLEACHSLHWPRQLHEKNTPIACGGFKRSGRRRVLNTLAKFSHRVRCEWSRSKKQCNIYPCADEVWALYRNWSTEWEGCNTNKCSDYDVVEVQSTSISMIEVSFLEKNSSYKAVFGPKVSNGQSCRMEIPTTELLRFSHRIPSYRLTVNNGAQLEGLWELDPVSVPGNSLHPNCA